MKNTENKIIATIPLKDAYNKGVHTKRAKKSISLIRKYICRHAKTQNKNIKIGVQLNEFIWKNGIKNTPRKIKIQILKKEDILIANLLDVNIESEQNKLKEKKSAKEEKQKQGIEKQAEELKKEAKLTEEKIKEKEAKVITEEKIDKIPEKTKVKTEEIKKDKIKPAQEKKAPKK